MTSSRTASDVIRIVVLGSAGNGKTALVVKLLSGRFIWTYDPTLEGLYKHSLSDTSKQDKTTPEHSSTSDEEADGECFNVEIMDTAGSIGLSEREQKSKLDGYIKWADGFVLVYSITDRGSLDEVQAIRERIHEQKKDTGYSLTIIANKNDLAHLRQVETGEGRRIANGPGSSFYEISAKTDSVDNIKQPFLNLCRDVKVRLIKSGVKIRRRSSAGQLLRKLIQKKLSI